MHLYKASRWSGGNKKNPQCSLITLLPHPAPECRNFHSQPKILLLLLMEEKHNSACKHLLKHWRKKLRIQYKENNFYFINRGKWPQPDLPRLPRGLKHTCTHRNTCTRSCAHIHGGDTCVNHLLGTLSLYTRKKKRATHVNTDAFYKHPPSHSGTELPKSEITKTPTYFIESPLSPEWVGGV